MPSSGLCYPKSTYLSLLEAKSLIMNSWPTWMKKKKRLFDLFEQKRFLLLTMAPIDKVKRRESFQSGSSSFVEVSFVSRVNYQEKKHLHFLPAIVVEWVTKKLLLRFLARFNDRATLRFVHSDFILMNPFLGRILY